MEDHLVGGILPRELGLAATRDHLARPFVAGIAAAAPGRATATDGRNTACLGQGCINRSPRRCSYYRIHFTTSSCPRWIASHSGVLMRQL
ncbi:hypothetical protein N7519_000781 [Penicillium mononematosum]|uniref:uncharacterized protein n=1 Tax=Penicillium mononematosum TaxID=268346 RepID=UPI0025482849|nr:uncharacterized protein N7519_000781 [Penicillium mononematosum]KAJ6190760.1 hypothetical protein N7519_000781 [Penicillium mononematosum]